MSNDCIKNPLPIPEQCDNCASYEVEFVGNEAVYGRSYGKWPYVYFCSSCQAAVGCHPGTRIPLGRMADKKTRQLRARAHTHFDPLWKSGAMSRTEAYRLLSRNLNIPAEQCHISQMNVEQLKFVIEHCRGFSYEGNLQVMKRRKGKKDAKRTKRIEREKRQKFHNGKRVEGPNPFLRRARRSKLSSGKGVEGD